MKAKELLFPAGVLLAAGLVAALRLRLRNAQPDGSARLPCDHLKFVQKKPPADMAGGKIL